ncbi:MAG TPA: hypothetical protein VM165_19125 [Planctomycetaceae bacterium]|nr:hypothetical protein [Planctomycetaceae bacterium]
MSRHPFDARFAVATLLAICLGMATTFGDEPETTAELAKRERLAAMTAVIDVVTLQTTGDSPKTLSRSEHPLLRYTNPVTSQFAEGILFLWLDGKRPQAAVSPSCRDGGTIYWELTSLSDEPLRLTRDGVAVWQPKSGSRPSARLPGAPEPAATPSARLAQLRAQARRFVLREERRGGWQEGRLLTRPLYQWEDREHGIIDGALFGFAETTDPEVLLLIEARQPTGATTAEWWFAIAKMTSSPCVMSLDEQEIWNASGYWKNPRGPEDPYVEAIVGKIAPALLQR